MLRRVCRNLPRAVQRSLYKGGQRSDRLRDPATVVAALHVATGDVVADLGPGYGHFTFELANAVGPDGVAYAADASRETLDDLVREAEARAIPNVRPVLVSRTRLELPEPVDLLFVSATYHHLQDPVAYFTDARSQLKPGARVAILESRLEGLLARQMNSHGSVPWKVAEQMRTAGYDIAETHDVVYGHWYAVFRARAA